MGRRKLILELAVPEPGTPVQRKHYLLCGWWRRCDHCRKRAEKMWLRDRGFQRVWVCEHCKGNLIYLRWKPELEHDLLALHNIDLHEFAACDTFRAQFDRAQIRHDWYGRAVVE